MDLILGLGLSLPVIASVGVGTVTGVAQGVAEQKRVNAENSNESRMLKFHIDVRASNEEDSKTGNRSRSRSQREVDGGILVLRDDKLFIEPRSSITRQPLDVTSHPFTGFYFQYPDDDRAHTRGLVSTISRDPPVLNWIYVDKDTYEVKYSNRSGSIAHHVGSFDWTEEEGPDSGVTLDGFEGFVGVEEDHDNGEGVKGTKRWAVYFDEDDDGLKAKRNGRRVVEISLVRRVISEQEMNKWGLEGQGNIGFKATKEI